MGRNGPRETRTNSDSGSQPPAGALAAEREARAAAERAAERLERLQAVTEQLLAAGSARDIAHVIVTEGAAALGASAAVVATLAEDGRHLEVIGSAGHPRVLLAEGQRIRLDSATPLAEAARTMQPVWVNSCEERATRFPSLATEAAAELYQSWAAVPLMIGSRAIGAFGLSFTAPGVLGPTEKR